MLHYHRHAIAKPLHWLFLVAFLAIAIMPTACHRQAAEPESTRAACASQPLAIQILGSGGPIADDQRAASAYLIWRQGKSRILIDAGGGSFQRFGASGASLDDLYLIALTHLHTDHSAALPALMKGAYFSSRKKPLPISGPSGNHLFPATDEYLQALFDPRRGAYRYLAGLLDGSDGLFALPVQVLDAEQQQEQTVNLEGPIHAHAIGVHHGIVPALAYRFDDSGKSIVFAGDQSANNPHMAAFAHNADVLVMHAAIPPDADRGARSLHATPGAIGELAAQAQVGRLVLSHWMQRSLRQQEKVLAAVKKKYAGPTLVASDLQCIVL